MNGWVCLYEFIELGLLSGWPQEVPGTVNLVSRLTPDYWSNGHGWNYRMND